MQRSKAGRAWLSPRTERRAGSECSRRTATRIWKVSKTKDSRIYLCFWLEQDKNPWRRRIFFFFFELVCYVWVCVEVGREGFKHYPLAGLRWTPLSDIQVEDPKAWVWCTLASVGLETRIWKSLPSICI